jgi:hypothetical protein
MPETSPDFFRMALKKFKAADELFSSKSQSIRATATGERNNLVRNTEMARQVTDGFIEQIEGTGSFEDLTGGLDVSPHINAQVSALKNQTVAVKQREATLARVEKQIESLEENLKSALADEGRMRLRRNVGLVILAVVLIGGVIFAHFELLQNTTLEFSFSLDGKPLPADKTPVCMLDGRSFASGGHFKPGHHHFQATLKGAEPLERGFWSFYGKTDLGVLSLESSRGSLSVSVIPAPATIIVQQDGQTAQQGSSPLKLEKLPVGGYSLLIRHGDYEEGCIVTVERQQTLETNIILNLGNARLSSDPSDADFELSGGGKRWQGHLPIQIADVPAGEYQFAAERKGWRLEKNITVSRNTETAGQIEFPYGSIEVTSDPSGLMVSTNGVEIGRTPVTLHELQPDTYTISITDGESDTIADVSVGEKEAAKHSFVFRYGSIQLSSQPSGAVVLRKGKEVGTTPLTLDHMPIGTTVKGFELRMDGYVSTNVTMFVPEGEMATCTVKLFSERYFDAMNEAHEAFASGKYVEAQNLLAAASEAEPDDPAADALGRDIAAAIETQKRLQLAAEQEAAEEKARAIAAQLQAIENLTPLEVVRYCWNSQAEPFPAPSYYRMDATAVPVYAASEVVATGLKVAFSPLKLVSKQPRFDQVRFLEKYQNHTYRYFGIIASVDQSQKTVVFERSTASPGGKVSASGGSVTIASSTSKTDVAVVAHLQEDLSTSPVPLEVGKPVWVSGRATSLQPAGINFFAPNQITLDDCVIYSPTLISAGR